MKDAANALRVLRALHHTLKNITPETDTAAAIAKAEKQLGNDAAALAAQFAALRAPKLHDRTPAVDPWRERANIDRAIKRMRTDIKDSTLPFSPRRRQLVAAVDALEREIKEQKIEPRAAIAAATKKLGKDAQLILGRLEEARGPMPSAAARQNRIRALATLGERLERDIKTARDMIRKSDAPREEKRTAERLLAAHEKQISRALGRVRSR